MWRKFIVTFSRIRDKGEYIMLHAQIQAQQFYEKQGYLSYGGIEYDENCPHIWMLKKIIGEEK